MAIRYERQLSVGPDGVAYAAFDEEGEPVVVRRLFTARMQPRWPDTARRLALAEQVRHPHVLPMRTAQLEGRDPLVITPRWDTGARSGDRRTALALVGAIAHALAEAHRFGVAHGRLCGARLALDPEGAARIDLAGVDTGDAEPLLAEDHACAPPEREPGAAGDVYALGMLAAGLLGAAPARGHEREATRVGSNESRLDALLAEMTDPDPTARPSMAEVVVRLGRAAGPGGASETTLVMEPRSVVPVDERERIGRFRIREMVGRGGMGQVFRAIDTATNKAVALKVLHAHVASNEAHLRRFYREAGLLRELDNPHIARFIDVNEDAGLHYLAMEFVDGTSLSDVIDAEIRIEPKRALDIVRDVALALADVHDLGVVHRDVKPANILLVEGEGDARRVKLCDFGVARKLEAHGELTSLGVAVGTPHYMSPEQCVGGEVDASSDVYSLGITLYKMLAGYVPFNAAEASAIVYKHLTEEPPDLRQQHSDLPEPIVRLCERMLQKKREDRIPDARQLLDEIEALRRGSVRDIGAHPRRPAEGQVYEVELDLEATPLQLWPHVSDTERLNRAIDLGAVEWTRKNEDGTVVTYGRMRHAGMQLEWRENPYEWVAPHRMGVLREYSAGPFWWLRSSVELRPRGSGTHLTHRIELAPRGVLGRAAAAMEVGYKARKNLERVYQHIDAWCSAQRGRVEPPPGEPAPSVEPDDTSRTRPLDPQRLGSTPDISGVMPSSRQGDDPFEDQHDLRPTERARLQAVQERLLDLGLDSDAVHRLCDFVRWAPAQAVARIRPRALARRFRLDHRDMLRACLHGAREGLLLLLWDIVCPRCRIPSSVAESLRVIAERGRCDVCDVDFEHDFGSSVEVIFRVHPQVRPSDLGTYCVGGPGHSPHVLAQVALAAGERFEMDLGLDEGSYEVRGRPFTSAWSFRVQHGARLSRWEVALRAGLPAAQDRHVASGRQRLVLANDYDREVLVRLERGGNREEAITAAEVATTALFRELFPAEILAPGLLVGVGHVAFLFVELCDAWATAAEADVFAALSRLRTTAEEHGTLHGGAVVKLHGDGVLLSFHDVASATRAAAALHAQPDARAWRIAVHAGPALATTINERLDYFGRTVRDAAALLAATAPGQMVLSEVVCADPAVAPQLSDEALLVSLVHAGDVLGQAVVRAA
jgi:class 3 adenylate cyclase